jgi:DNA-binding GntR family transcriptional regulator
VAGPTVQPTEDSGEALAAIAQSVIGSFHTVEAMTETFIRQAILRGVFRPGERLSLDAIAKTLGVSRMPVRASLRQLESEGLVEIQAHRGVTVSSLSAREISEVYELRVVLERYLLERAITNMDPATLAQLTDIIERLEQTESRDERMDLRHDFYTRLYGVADRPRALAQVNNLRASVGRYLLLQRVEEPLLGHHGRLLEFIRAGDVDGATAWLSSHLEHVADYLSTLVAKGSPAPV